MIPRLKRAQAALVVAAVTGASVLAAVVLPCPIHSY